MLPQEMFLKKKHSETLFPAFLETKYRFPRQDRGSLKFSLIKSKIFNGNGQMAVDGRWGDGHHRIFSCLYHCEFIFYRISKKRHKVTEVNLCQL